MANNLYVGNLPYTTTADDLREAFSQFGTVTRAQVVSDRETGRSRGFGFVEMSDGADQAIEAMNGASFQGRTLTVNEARPRDDRGPRPPRSGGDYGGGGGGGYGGGGGGGYGGGGGGGYGGGGYGGGRY
ncbi:MAG: RNA-binding protein [Planctomycetaceae bacterium]|jgi:RNA recognition motif-containing protein|nr:RNA-binding protein [Planctomycetaceae bacterium]